MTRTATIIKESEDSKRCIAIDNAIYKEFLDFINTNSRYRNKFLTIAEFLLGGHTNRSLYDKEEPDSKSKGVRAMKFFKGNENHRIYCREQTLEDKTFVIIASEIHMRKKQTKLSHRELTVIHRVASYEYNEIK